MAWMALAPAAISLLGSIFGGKKKKTEMASQFDPKTEAFRQAMMSDITNRQKQGEMYARMPQQSLNASTMLYNRFFPNAQQPGYSGMARPGQPGANQATPQLPSYNQQVASQGQGINPQLLAVLQAYLSKQGTR